MPATRIRTVLADEQALYRRAVRSLFERTGRIEVVAEADSGLGALLAVRQHSPDLVVTELSLPQISGADLARRVRSDGCAARFLFLSVRGSKEDVEEAIRAGGGGYVCKTDSPEELLAAVESVAKGLVHFSPRVTAQPVDIAPTSEPGGRASLTTREREILRLIAEGLSSKEVARELAISPRTVECHRAHLMDKIGARNVSGLIRYAIREGLVAL